MMRLSPPDVALRDTGAADPIGHLLGSDLAGREQPETVIVGFPPTRGVQRKVGASQGPAALRKAFYQLVPDGRSERFHRLLTRTRDLADLEISGDLETDQRRLGEVIAPFLAQSTFVIVLGGGHETSYGHFLGYAISDRPVSILNWDAHPDVRELKEGKGHSGSPFRQALEDSSGACRRYAVAGLEPHAVARAHLDYVQHRGRVWWREDVSREAMPSIYDSITPPSLVSFDFDAVSQSEAPGSAPRMPVG